MVIKVFIDTNVMIDFLDKTREGYTCASQILELIIKHKIEGLITTQTIIDAAYICRKNSTYDDTLFRETIQNLLYKINLGYLDYFNVKTAFRDTNKDIEDNAMIAHAEDACCDVFLTQDRKLLSRPKRPVMLFMTPQDFLSRCLVND
ncbi:MAG: PIN domain-containing protein [Bacteroidales bacterium]|nr:PIN domain-containing protein [Bacteroidales bacterium]